MSTRSRIGRKNADGTITSIYCRFDGYPEGVGAMLAKHYTDPAKVDALMALGDIEGLNVECQNPPDGHSYDAPAKGHTVAYGRDRGEDGVDALTHAGDKWPRSGQDYTYLFDGETWGLLLRDGTCQSIMDAIADRDSDD